MAWSFKQIRLELHFTFKISRNSSDFKTNFIVDYTEGSVVGRGECAPNIRYGETVEAVYEQLDQFNILNPKFEHLEALASFLSSSHMFQCVKNAIETCFVDYLAKRKNLQVCEILNINKPLPKPTMFTVPLMPTHELKAFYEKYDLQRFAQIKLKINQELGVTNVHEMSKIIGPRDLFIDANEAFNGLDAYISFQSEIQKLSLGFVEQPFPAQNVDDYIKLKPISLFPIFGDESILYNVDYDLLTKQFHGVNVKMMKTGGYLEAIRILQKSKILGLKTMIGCMVETTIGIRHAYEISDLADYLDLDSFMYIKDEPYQEISFTDGKIGS